MRLSAGLSAALLLLAPAQALALPPVWVVHDGDSTITLFGSVHLLPPNTDWRPQALAKAISGADDVWFEAPMDDKGRAAAAQAAADNALLPQGQGLVSMLSPKGRERLAKAASELGFTAPQMDRLQPWYAELLISSGQYQKLGVEGSEGVEQQLWAGLPATARRRSLETPAEQINLFAHAPMPEQVASLEETLRTSGDAKRQFEVLLHAWLAGDLKRLDKEAVSPLRKVSPGLYRIVVQQRNARWVDAIAERMQGAGHTVVVVGMGHLIGPDGLPAQLRARGYQVDGPK